MFSVTCCLWANSACAQSASQISGQVTDPQKAAVPNAQVRVVNQSTRVARTTKTNDAGYYSVPFLEPGKYEVFVEASGFGTATTSEVTLTVGQVLVVNFDLRLGSASEKIVVTEASQQINTTDGSVSTVVDRQFAENLPLNGRSFQSLLYLTPGVTLNVGSGPTNGAATGQFTVNGQRASANYWMVDGVGANIGISSSFMASNGPSGSLGAFNAIGGTNSLVSVDALQEFRIQTSTYAPEFGRTPGGQISIVTRSGANTLHGSAFDYLRNGVLDANNWFGDADGLPKGQERQNDFGGTLGGPIMKDKLFFFFSYEGLRVTQPETVLTTVPDLASRQAAVPAIQPFLNAFPMPNPGKADVGPNIAPFDATFPNPSSVNAYSIRGDYTIAKNLTLFDRFNYSPSTATFRGGGGCGLSSDEVITSTTETETVGLTWTKSSNVVNELRYNYSSLGGSQNLVSDTFGGAIMPPIDSVLPSGFNLSNTFWAFYIAQGTDTTLCGGYNGTNRQHQNNVIDTLSIQKGPHALKVGIDYRRLTPYFGPDPFYQSPGFFTVANAETGNAYSIFEGLFNSGIWLYKNLGTFVQDTWRVNPRLTLTYGVRWDIDFTPSTVSGPSFTSVSGFSLTNLSQLKLRPSGAPIYSTQYGNFAPRLGVAYQLSQNPNWGRVVRGGFGVFYDLASSELGTQFPNAYPFGVYANVPGNFPLTPPLTVPAIIPPSATQGNLIGFDPNLNLPYTLEWNVAFEQALGASQTLTVSYVGSAGRRLLATESITAPNPNYAQATLVANGGVSNYGALQLQFQRRLSRNLQVLASYNWSHSIDDGSYGAYTNGSLTDLSANKGDSDFDIRNSFSLALTYDVAVPRINAFADAILRGWSTQNVVQVHSAPPVSVVDAYFAFLTKENSSIQIRPDVSPGQPLYVYGPQYPGGKAVNPNAFMSPPIDPATGNPLRQGNLGRNAVRAFGLTEWDFSVHREFPIYERLKLQFRAEMFNVLNHPNFSPFDPNFGIGDPSFGQATQILGQYLSGYGPGYGGFSSLYNLGGPRSIQLALKLVF
jgi:hypothetical protein